MIVVNEYGADAIRLYLVCSNLVKAEPLKFKKEEVYGIVRDVFLPLYNSYRFLLQSALRYELKTNVPYKFDPSTKFSTTNVTDRWIVAATQNLIKQFRHEMDHYQLFGVTSILLKFLNDFSNWYIRLNRSKRLKGETDDQDWK